MRFRLILQFEFRKLFHVLMTDPESWLEETLQLSPESQLLSCFLVFSLPCVLFTIPGTSIST